MGPVLFLWGLKPDLFTQRRSGPGSGNSIECSNEHETLVVSEKSNDQIRFIEQKRELIHRTEHVRRAM